MRAGFDAVGRLVHRGALQAACLGGRGVHLDGRAFGQGARQSREQGGAQRVFIDAAQGADVEHDAGDARECVALTLQQGDDLDGQGGFMHGGDRLLG